MKNKTLINLLSMVVFIFALFLFASCSSSSSNETSNNTSEAANTTTSESVESSSIETIVDVYFTITFKDYDGTILQASSVKSGDMPSYNKSDPTRENDDDYSYTFSGWSPSITNAVEDVVYTAIYTSEALPYNVTINLDGGTSSQTKLQFKTDKVSKEMLPFDVKKKGYAFKGYELNNVKVYDEKGNVIND
ncbi:MAG: hypothetical protein K6E20_02580, partial [Acholeplasmatales bacterium]|nr:hypothetical protein [Acholeplasmatales bacterium]